LGDRQPVDVDFRLISATRRDLEREVAEGNFREDFFYRINVIMIRVPPLRERKEDIPLLVQHFLQKYSRETIKQVDRVDRRAMELLKYYDWPGNVRELENAIERAVVLSKARTLGPEAFSFLSAPPAHTFKRGSLQDVERHYIEEVLGNCAWNVTQAAKILDINRVTLHKMIKRHNLRRPS
ncbi:MAG: sigma-54-dependent Fis family transcriptional regulator, partial [Deltaproteobacteria bacterium]|nr:sigma-54-dependent Fis family transcriptional regulator [Deltaproteobacteria bacterium]